MPQTCQIEMAKYVASLKRSSRREQVVSYWKASILSVLPSRLMDVVSNSIMAGAEIAKHPIASGIDRLVAIGSGQRTRMFDSGDLGRASYETVRQLKQDTGMALRGMDPFDSARKFDQVHGETDYSDVPLVGTPLGMFVNGVFRLMAAADAPFTRLAFERSLREQARILGTRQGLAGPELAEFIERTIPLMPDEMVVRAFHDAQVATFKDDTPVAKILSGAKRAVADVPGAATALDLFFPFTRIPSNVAHRTVEYSGAGWIMGYFNLRRAFKMAKLGNTSEAARFQAYAVDQMARGSLGVAAVAAGYWLAEDGNMTLGYPEDQGERAMWEATGKSENSIRIGDKWYPVVKVAPVGPLMLIGGYLRRAQDGGEAGPAQMASTALASMGTVMSDQPAFQGTESLQQIKEDPIGGGWKFAQRQAASLVPGMLAQVAQWQDPVVRERDAIGEHFMARIPGLRDNLTPRADVFGQRVPTATGFADNFLNPFRPRPDRTARNEFLRELDRVGFQVTRLRKAAGESQEDFYRRRELEGTMLRDVLLLATQDPTYTSIPEGRRWMAANVPGISSKNLEARIREEQREFLEAVAEVARREISQARRAGTPLTLPDAHDWLGQEAADAASGRLDNRRRDEEALPVP